ncbi:MAG: hypothetical protein ACRD3W_04360, partial [Terriglobales bacterium]
MSLEQPLGVVSAPAQGTDASAALNNEIHLHQQKDKDQSYLSRAVSFIWNGGSDDSLKKLEQLQAATKTQQLNPFFNGAMQTQIQTAVKQDRNALESRDTVSGYATGALTTAALFLGGRMGMASTVGIYALNQMKPGDSIGGQVADGLMGGVKGLALRKTFQLVGEQGWNPVQQGVAIGFASRVADLGLNRNSYLDEQGHTDLLGGGLNVLKQAADPRSLAVDGVMFALAHGMLRGGDALSGGRLMQSPLARTMATGTSFGFIAGSSNEISREQSMGE